MPDIGDNLRRWDHEFDWAGHEEWSTAWGGSEAQWRCTLLPRLAAFLPADLIVEIAPGHGRWTRFLVPRCRRFIGIDLSPGCVEACRSRFASVSHATFHANDGRSLGDVPDRSAGLVFSFDSLVHADRTVMSAYLAEIARVLAGDGVAFLHHSNLGSYRRHYAIASRIPRGRRWLAKVGLVEAWYGWRDPTVGAAWLRSAAEDAGLRCVSQEEVNWGTRRLIDCLSVIVRPGSRWDRPARRVRNPWFMAEAAAARRLAELYPGEPTPRALAPA